MKALSKAFIATLLATTGSGALAQTQAPIAEQTPTNSLQNVTLERQSPLLRESPLVVRSSPLSLSRQFEDRCPTNLTCDKGSVVYELPRVAPSMDMSLGYHSGSRRSSDNSRVFTDEPEALRTRSLAGFRVSLKF